jgi:DNA anti-recombination protein RmuC
LKRRDLELQESLLRFTRFLQENDAKRAKAARRATEEARLRVEREAEIVQLQGEAEACCAERERMQAALQRIVK